MGRPPRHDDKTAERLLDEAERLLSEGGADAVTVRAVAAATGVSVRAVYATLDGKDGLVAGLVARAFTQLAVRVEEMPESADPSADLVRLGLEAFRAFALDTPHLYRLTFEQVVLAPPGGPPPWTEAGQRAQNALARWVARALDAAPRPSTDLAAATVHVHALSQGLASCEVNGVFRGMGVRDAERQWRESLTALVRGLTT